MKWLGLIAWSHAERIVFESASAQMAIDVLSVHSEQSCLRHHQKGAHSDSMTICQVIRTCRFHVPFRL